MLCAITKSGLEQLSLIPWHVRLKTDLRGNEQISSAGSRWDLWLKIFPFYASLLSHVTSMNSFSRTHQGFKLRYFHFYSLFPLLFLSSPGLPPLVYITALFCHPYRAVALLYACIWTQTKASHVGMHELQICCRLCSWRDELLERLHSSLSQWDTHTNQNHCSVSFPASSGPRGKWKKAHLHNLSQVLVSQITKGSVFLVQ